MPSGADGNFYRTHGQAERFGKKAAASENQTESKQGMNHTEDAAVGKGSHIVAIKHGGTPEAPEPPFHVKHADGSKHGPMQSHEELHQHLAQHFAGGEGEQEAMQPNENMDGDYASEGTKEAIDSLLG
jgi:hypothetical protein